MMYSTVNFNTCIAICYAEYEEYELMNEYWNKIVFRYYNIILVILHY